MAKNLTKSVMHDYEKIGECRISNSTELTHVLDLGHQPLANNYQNEADVDIKRYPLNLLFSTESSLVQIKETVDKNILFDHYNWVSGTSKSTHLYAEYFFSKVMKRIRQEDKDLVIEIASNDGTFLKPFVESRIPVLGIEPAKNIARLANDSGITTVNEFWSEELAIKLKKVYSPAKVVIARNVIPHVSDLQSVIAGIETILDDNGIGIIEFHDACKILEECQYDSIYHEHLCYFTTKTLMFLLNKHQLHVYDIHKSPISGGSHVVYFSKSKKTKTRELVNIIEKEEKSGVNTLSAWQNFAQRVIKHKKETLEIINSFSSQTIVGFGASARSQTYLNYCQLDNQSIKSIIDNNPMKHGRYTPKSSIPIVDIQTGLRFNPDIIFVLAWNFKDEIINQCRNHDYNGPFLIPFPSQPYVVE